jgi:hypothetical protein
MLKQIGEEIGIISAWIKAYRLVASDDACHAAYSTARRDLEEAYARLAEAQDLRLNAQSFLKPAPPVPTPPVPSPPVLVPPVPPPPPAPVPLTELSRHPVSARWLLAVAALILSLPSGLVALIYAVRVRTSLKRGDETAAERFSAWVRAWFWISVGLFLLSTLVIVIEQIYSTPPTVLYPGP